MVLREATRARLVEKRQIQAGPPEPRYDRALLAPALVLVTLTTNILLRGLALAPVSVNWGPITTVLFR